MIELKELSKDYGKTKALDHLNLTIKEGKIFGFLGHNGAGKSTTIKSLVSIIEPTDGEIIIDHQKLAEHRLQIKEKIGYVPDTPDLFLQLTAAEYWDLMAAAFSLGKAQKETRLEKLTELFEMIDHQNETIGSFSHGMRKKTIVIGALLPDPEIWILDEPTQGLDPQAAYDLKQMMRTHADAGKTVIFSTHDLATAQQLCDELAILKKGELIYNGTVDDLLAQSPNESLESIYLKMTGKASHTEVQGDDD
ncbi:3-dehydroquinate dehydratase [Tetragenococcus halophilus subsp. flandriensis]|uniref:ABC transporter ATP-binding protein n=1 Tax=Tetragenococcus halophilus TaxID=51669 RepID=UPI0023E9BBD0|nr:ABC transporter ATP-binding protein [Tetragenococcus halophilus]GMA07199.1 3-dehydroquinate dehydratase [Tetragenococcus halophilus subsp. flandriensis]